MSSARTIAVVETDDALAFPPECPSCGGPAATRVRLVKIFARRSGTGIGWSHCRVNVYTCEECARAHQAAAHLDQTAVRQIRLRQAMQSRPMMIAAGSLIACGVLLAVAGAGAAARFRSLVEPAALTAVGLGVIAAGVGLFVGGWLVPGAVIVPADWPDAQHAVEARRLWGRRVIIAIPPTTLSRAVDFSDDRQDSNGDASWRMYTFAREGYAQQFAELNSARLHGRAGSRLARGSPFRARRTLYYVTGAALAAAFVWSVLG